MKVDIVLNVLCGSLQIHFRPPSTLPYALRSFTGIVTSWGWDGGGKNNGKSQRNLECGRRSRSPCSCFWFFLWVVNAYTPLFMPQLLSGDLVLQLLFQ